MSFLDNFLFSFSSDVLEVVTGKGMTENIAMKKLFTFERQKCTMQNSNETVWLMHDILYNDTWYE